MNRLLIRLAATVIAFIGVIMLGRLIFMVAKGSLASYVFPNTQPPEWMHAAAVVLALPVPLHIISIGLILQRRWLSPRWSRFAWIAIVTSGLWLAGALTVKLIIKL